MDTGPHALHVVLSKAKVKSFDWLQKHNVVQLNFAPWLIELHQNRLLL